MPPKIIKDETITFSEYPCFALSMNADARSFLPEIVKRCLMIYTRTSLPGDDPTARRKLQRSVASIRERLTTSIYQLYLKRMLAEMDALRESGGSEGDEVDALELSSTELCRIFQENLPTGAEIPTWCSPMTLSEYQSRAFERPRLILENLLHTDKYSRERKPTAGSWTITGDTVIIATDIMASGRMKSDIPDWILDDTASVSDQIVPETRPIGDVFREACEAPTSVDGSIRYLNWIASFGYHQAGLAASKLQTYFDSYLTCHFLSMRGCRNGRRTQIENRTGGLRQPRARRTAAGDPDDVGRL